MNVCLFVNREFMHLYEQTLVIVPKKKMATIKTEFAGNIQSNNRLFSVSQVGFHSHIFSLDGGEVFVVSN